MIPVESESVHRDQSRFTARCTCLFITALPITKHVHVYRDGKKFFFLTRTVTRFRKCAAKGEEGRACLGDGESPFASAKIATLSLLLRPIGQASSAVDARLCKSLRQVFVLAPRDCTRRQPQ
jgi:hypothetical protein